VIKQLAWPVVLVMAVGVSTARGVVDVPAQPVAQIFPVPACS
jgi:hypothetical protein